MITRRQWLGGTATLACWIQARQAAAANGFAGLPAVFASIEVERGGRLGVAVLDTGTNRRAGHRQHERFPLGSTFKLLAAGAVLARADAGQDRMDRRIHYAREELVTYSPETEKHAGGGGMTLAALCEAAITLSDNTAGNLLLGLLDGPQGLTGYLRGLRDATTRLDRTEPNLNEARPGDPRDTTSPASMLADMRAMTVGTALLEPARTTLQEWLRHNKTGDARLRARLPNGWGAGEKTGTSEHGTSNDVGLLWPPNDRSPVLVAAYLTEGPPDGNRRDAALADVGAAIAAACAVGQGEWLGPGRSQGWVASNSGSRHAQRCRPLPPADHRRTASQPHVASRLGSTDQRAADADAAHADLGQALRAQHAVSQSDQHIDWLRRDRRNDGADRGQGGQRRRVEAVRTRLRKGARGRR